MSASRRMWSRRVLRAGWLIAPIFTMPKRAFRWCITDYKGRVCKTNIALTIMMAIFFCTIAGCIFGMWYSTRYASTSRIQKAMADYKCTPTMAEMIASQNTPVQNYWISAREDECQKVIDDDKILREQQKAIK